MSLDNTSHPGRPRLDELVQPAFAILKESFGDRYLYAGLGTTLLLGPKVTVKAEAGQSSRQAMDADDVRSYREAMMRGPLRALLGATRALSRAPITAD